MVDVICLDGHAGPKMRAVLAAKLRHAADMIEQDRFPGLMSATLENTHPTMCQAFGISVDLARNSMLRQWVTSNSGPEKSSEENPPENQGFCGFPPIPPHPRRTSGTMCQGLLMEKVEVVLSHPWPG